jgi:hypothetical protein
LASASLAPIQEALCIPDLREIAAANGSLDVNGAHKDIPVKITTTTKVNNNNYNNSNIYNNKFVGSRSVDSS